jgi:hypothetical protein
VTFHKDKQLVLYSEKQGEPYKVLPVSRKEAEEFIESMRASGTFNYHDYSEGFQIKTIEPAYFAVLDVQEIFIKYPEPEGGQQCS